MQSSGKPCAAQKLSHVSAQKRHLRREGTRRCVGEGKRGEGGGGSNSERAVEPCLILRHTAVDTVLCIATHNAVDNTEEAKERET